MSGYSFQITTLCDFFQEKWVTYPHALHSRHGPERPERSQGPHGFEGLNASGTNQ